MGGWAGVCIAVVVVTVVYWFVCLGQGLLCSPGWPVSYDMA